MFSVKTKIFAASVLSLLTLALASCGEEQVQRPVKVLETIRTKFTGGNNTRPATSACLVTWIRPEKLQDMLDKGAKVVTRERYSDTTDYKPENYSIRENVTCGGMSYVLEGKKSLFNNLYN